MEIKLDLCDLFGVKEGQEFKANWNKYKIENNQLKVYFSESDKWSVSELELNRFARDFFKYEILPIKKELPTEIRVMFENLKNNFNCCGIKKFFANEKRIFKFYSSLSINTIFFSEPYSFTNNATTTFYKWCRDNLTEESYTIDDILNGIF